MGNFQDCPRFDGHSGNTGTPHCVTKDDWYEGQHIWKGTIILPNLTALSQDPELYPEPTEFHPERFAGHNLSAAESAIHPDYRQRDHFHYGFGRRLCPGIHVAEASLFIVIARLLWAYDITAKPGHPLSMKDKQCIFETSYETKKQIY